LTKLPDSAQLGHFFGLQRPSFSNPHFSQFQTAMTFSFQQDGFVDKFSHNYKQDAFPVKDYPRLPYRRSSALLFYGIIS
jgi:hypothetical protein